MSPEQRLDAIENKLDLLLARLVDHMVPAEKIREVELEGQYLEAFREVSVNPALLREFVQSNPAWVAKYGQKAA